MPAGQNAGWDAVLEVLRKAKAIGRHLESAKIVVDKSTVPAGTGNRACERIAGMLGERGGSADFEVFSNPEFLKEGGAVADFMKPDRVIIGSDSPEAATTLELLHAPFSGNRNKVVHMDVRSAQLTNISI